MPDMVPSLNTDLKIEMPREVFDKMAQLIDTVCSQQDVIAQQQSVINKVLNPPPLAMRLPWMAQIQREIEALPQLDNRIWEI